MRNGANIMKNCLKQYRLLVLLSEERLGEKCGCSAQTIKSIEKEKYVPSLLLACRIAEAVGRSLDKVFCLEMKEGGTIG